MPSAPGDHSSDSDGVESLSREVLALLAKITHRFESQEHQEWQWIATHSPSSRVVDLLQDSTITTMRVLDAIGRLEPVNGITISMQFGIPKGTVSKVARRLISKRVISTESLPNNRKEILFRLTSLGRELFEFHRAFDEQMERGFLQFLQGYDESDLRLLVRVLRDATQASFLTLGLHESPPQADHAAGAPQRYSGKDSSGSGGGRSGTGED